MVSLLRPEGNEPQDLNMTRRGVASLFFAGYALAAVAAEADPIRTSDEGLIQEEVMLPATDRPIPAFVARPSGRGRHGVVIVASEIFGIHEYIKDVCRRLATVGYVAVAPAFFVRAGDPAGVTDMAEIRRIVGAATDPQVMGDIRATLTYLRGRPYADMQRVGVTGFCWGGGVTWLACQEFREIRAGAAWYGRLAPPPNAPADPNRLWPIQRVSQLHAPVLGLYAGRDALTAAVPAMRAALAAAGKRGSEIVVYDNAQHGFHADYRSSYDKASAEDGWGRMIGHFQRYGVGPRPFVVN